MREQLVWRIRSEAIFAVPPEMKMNKQTKKNDAHDSAHLTQIHILRCLLSWQPNKWRACSRYSMCDNKICYFQHRLEFFPWRNAEPYGSSARYVWHVRISICLHLASIATELIEYQQQKCVCKPAWQLGTIVRRRRSIRNSYVIMNKILFFIALHQI